MREFCETESSRQLLILDRGRIVEESTWQGADVAATADIASAQKSVVSMAVGVLIAQGVLDLDAPMSTWLGGGWTDAAPGEEEQILLRHPLSMTSGLYDDFGFEAPPGTVWYYNNNAYHQVRKAIEKATGRSSQEVFAELIFEPLGMKSSVWKERPKMLDPSGWALSGLHTTARDLARFGLAVVAGGAWDGKSLGADPAYLAASVAASQELNPSYGYLWWLLDADRAIVPGPPRDGSFDPRKSFGGRDVRHALAPSAPPGTLAAMGAGNMRLYVTPERGLVVVRLGGAAGQMAAAASNFDEALWQRLARAMPDETG